MAKNLFMISTPSQAFFLANSPELIEDAILVTLVKTESDKQKILFYLEKFEWISVYTVYIPKVSNSLQNAKIVYFRLWLETFKIKHPHFDGIFMGSYNNFFMLSIIAKLESDSRLFLLYDGLQMIHIAFERKMHGNFMRPFPRLFQQLGFKTPKLEEISFISPFPLSIGDRDAFTLIEKDVKGHRPKLLDDKIYFVGQHLVEAGLVQQDYFLEVIQNLKLRFYDKEIIYIPHPREKEDKLKEVARIVKITSFPGIFEEEYLASTEFPGTVISFYSSVLVNLCYLRTRIKVFAINIPSENIIHDDIVLKIEYIMQYLKTSDYSNLEVLEIEVKDETTNLS